MQLLHLILIFLNSGRADNFKRPIEISVNMEIFLYHWQVFIFVIGLTDCLEKSSLMQEDII